MDRPATDFVPRNCNFFEEYKLEGCSEIAVPGTRTLRRRAAVSAAATSVVTFVFTLTYSSPVKVPFDNPPAGRYPTPARNRPFCNRLRQMIARTPSGPPLSCFEGIGMPSLALSPDDIGAHLSAVDRFCRDWQR